MQTTVQQWGESLVTRIPASYAAQLRLENNSAIDIHLEGKKIVIIPLDPMIYKNSLSEWLATLEPIDEAFPEIEDPPPKEEDIF